METLKAPPKLKDMETWIDRLGHSSLRSFTDEEGHFWLEQNAAKASKWGRLAREGHKVAWEFTGAGGAYTGRMLIDGEIYTPNRTLVACCRHSILAWLPQLHALGRKRHHVSSNGLG